MFLKCIILGMVQGFTEFLPVSSSGHLVIFSSLLNFELSPSESVFFDVMLHVGTLFAVIYVMREEIFQMIKSPFSHRTYKLIIATIPAGVIGLLFSSYIEDMFDISCVFVGFYFTAFLLLFASSFAKSAQKKIITYKTSAIMGLMQSVALLPGVSRSGSTLLGGVFCGVSKSEVAKFSLLMSVPIILGSAILQVMSMNQINMSQELVWSCAVGGLSAFLFGVLGIRFFLAMLKKAKLEYFSYYLFALATIVLFLSQ